KSTSDKKEVDNVDVRGNAFDKLIEYAIQNDQIINASIELTNNCNQRCKFCYLDNFTEKGLDKDTIINLGRQLKDLGVVSVLFTGGELFLRKDALEILSAYNKMGFCLEIKTNGTIINETIIKKLKHLNLLDLQISIYETKDGFSGITSTNYSFSKLSDTIKKMIDNGIPVSLSVMVGKHNIDEIEQIHEKIKKIGDVNVSYSPYITPNRKGLEYGIELRLSAKELKEKFAPFLKKINGFTEQKKYRNCANDKTVCFAGKDQIAIGSDGNVYPCLDLRIVMGNIRKLPLNEILKNKYKFLNKFSITEIPKCMNCKIRDFCDSCIGVALIENGDYRIPSSHKCDVTKFFMKGGEK
ncbi:radical SAM protein, partial [Candidatus Gracilibacteria bacterium]|nr:radical SAM protein [Candidatus Gracilibacteria bacterium]